jgi:outer membrane protein, heavy metal efflux system
MLYLNDYIFYVFFLVLGQKGELNMCLIIQRRFSEVFFIFGAVLVGICNGCSSVHEPAVRNELTLARDKFVSTSNFSNGSDTINVNNKNENYQYSLADYISIAFEQNPEIRADFERWQASVLSISRARRLPDPTISFGYFVRSVETRVGPQRARVNLQQAFPWPTRLTAGADAASAQARAIQRRFEAKVLMVAKEVSIAYWNLWQLRIIRDIHSQHLEVIRNLSESVRTRLSIGEATLAELQQIDLDAARIEDNINAMNEQEHSAEAQLSAAIGVSSEFFISTFQEPGAALMPKETFEDLLSMLRVHPMVESTGFWAQFAESTARAENAHRLPSFTVGIDWIITGEATVPDIEDSGKDALIVGAGMTIPLWQGNYADGVAAAKAESRAYLAQQKAVFDKAKAQLTTTYSILRDAVRRVDLYIMTLVPQAEAVYESVLGAYMVGRGSVAQVLLSQRDLLELRIELQRARADYERAWSQLEEIAGKELTLAPKSSLGESDG